MKLGAEGNKFWKFTKLNYGQKMHTLVVICIGCYDFILLSKMR